MADILCFISGINNRDTALTENGPSGVFPEGPSKLSTKCRQLERQKWELPKKFPFLHRLYRERGLPSPLALSPCESDLFCMGLSTV